MDSAPVHGRGGSIESSALGVFVITASHRLLLLGAACWLLAAAGGVALAQDAGSGDPADDPPARAGRLALVEGSVSLQPAGVSDWNAAPVNQPLTEGDTLWSDSGSRAELDLGEARVRLDERSSVAILDLSDRAIQLRLEAGSIDVAVSDVADLDAFEIDAPNAAVSLLRPGEYRLTVDNASNTSVIVRGGQVQVQSSTQQLVNLGAGQRGLYGDNGSYAILQAGPPDDFDLWCQQRQARWAQEQAAAQYVSSDAVGYQDLNDNGQWQQEPDQGTVWFPSGVAADWVPYSTGHWAWVGPWGWSWIDNAPWGFAPFHYGRWGRFGARWGWIPCPPHQRAVYAPALVAWIGGPGATGAATLGGGAAVGWLPLAPGEVFIPAYRTSPRYLQNVNLSNSRRLNPALITSVAANPALQSHYANRDAPGALTVVPQVNFTAGQPVERHRVSAPAPWQSLAPVARVPAIAPERESVVGALTLNHISTPPGALFDRPVVTHRPPPMAAPGFDRQQHAIEANGGRPLDAAQLDSLREPGQIRRVPANANAHGASPAPAPAPANGHRGIPERSPQFQPPAQKLQPAPQGVEENVFERRDHQIEQEREAQQRQQKIQLLEQQRAQQTQHFQSQPQEVQRLQEQQRIQEQQRQIQQQRQLQSTPQPSQPAPAPAPAPHASPRPDFRRIPEQSSPPTPASSR